MLKLEKTLKKKITQLRFIGDKLIFLSKNLDDIGGRLIEIKINEREIIKIDKKLFSFNCNNFYYFLQVTGLSNNLVFDAGCNFKYEFDNFLLEVVNEGYYTLTKKERWLQYNIFDHKKIWVTELRTSAIYTFDDILIIDYIDLSAKTNRRIAKLDKSTGRVIWKTETINDEDFVLGGLLVTKFRDKVYVSTVNSKLYCFDFNTGELKRTWQFSYRPYKYNNKIGSIGVFHEELNLETQEFIKYDLKPERKRVSGSETGFEAVVNVIADGMGFMAKRNRDESGNPKHFTLYGMDMKTHKIVWSHNFEDIGMKNYRDLQYKNGKLYFLRGNGDLYIFEKETQT